MYGVGDDHTGLIGDAQADAVLRTHAGAGEFQAQVGTCADGVGLVVEHHGVAHIGSRRAGKADVRHLFYPAAGRSGGGDGLRAQACHGCDGRTVDHKSGVVGIGYQRHAAGCLVGGLHHQGVAGIGAGQADGGRGCTQGDPEHIAVDAGGVFGRELGDQISGQAAGALAARHTGFGREAGCVASDVQAVDSARGADHTAEVKRPGLLHGDGLAFFDQRV